MPTIKIVPFPGVPGPQGPRGLQGIQGEQGLTGPMGLPAEPVTYTATFTANGFEDAGDLTTARYIKNGKLVFVYVDVQLDNVTNFGSGQFTISLPFNPAFHSDAYAGTIHKYVDGEPTFYSLKGHIFPSDPKVYLWTIASPDIPFLQGSPVELTTSDRVHISFIYESE
jgi:hypothetical protein